MRLMLLALGLSLAVPASASDVVFYRCTDTAGHLTIQNSPCPKGMREEKKAMQGISTIPMGTSTKPTPPAPVVPPKPESVPEAPHEEPAEVIDDGKPRLPPPILFQCATYDRDSYITESSEPQKRCVPLRTIGLDGNPSTGVGQACDVVYDQCARVPDGALCDAWKKRLGETEVAWRFGRAENTQKNQAEFERVQRIVNESTCGVTRP